MSRPRKKYRADQGRPDVSTPCYLCEREVGATAERDHFPTPHSLGGTEVLPICRSCHDMKDRTRLDGWDPSKAFAALSGLWSKAISQERLVLVKMLHVTSQSVAVAQECVAKLEERAEVVTKERKRRAQNTSPQSEGRSTVAVAAPAPLDSEVEKQIQMMREMGCSRRQISAYMEHHKLIPKKEER